MGLIKFGPLRNAKFSKWNKGYRYHLMVLDIFSKYGWIVPLKNKKEDTVAAALKNL